MCAIRMLLIFGLLMGFSLVTSHSARAGLTVPLLRSVADCEVYLKDLNETFSTLAKAKEDGFWATKMGLAGASHEQFAIDDAAMSRFSKDPSHISALRGALARLDLSGYVYEGLMGWLRYFEVQSIADTGAQQLHREMRELEIKLQKSLSEVVTGYIDPETGSFVPATDMELGNQRSTDPVDARRKAAFEGLRAYEREVLSRGFLDILKLRLRLAKALGHNSYYDLQLQRRERMSEQDLFTLLGDLEEHTREPHTAELARIVAKHGAAALKPWNFGYFTNGSLTTQLDPYLPFERATELWTHGFAALGISYQGATVHIDLVDREGKYQNGFMHIPSAPYSRADGTFHPAQINLTCNAIPHRVGSGNEAKCLFL